MSAADLQDYSRFHFTHGPKNAAVAFLRDASTVTRVGAVPISI
jgi:hypothetical protein